MTSNAENVSIWWRHHALFAPITRQCWPTSLMHICATRHQRVNTRLRSFDRHFEYLISVGKQTGVNAARTPRVFRKLRFSAGDDGRKSMAIWKQRWIHHGQYSTQLRKHIMNTISVIWYKTRVSYHRLVLSNKATQISPNVLLPCLVTLICRGWHWSCKITAQHFSNVSFLSFC